LSNWDEREDKESCKDSIEGDMEETVRVKRR
jgi:hypothetical protein